MNLNKIYIIQHKETKELFIARSGKSSWKQPGHAKNAYLNTAGWKGCMCEEYGMPTKKIFNRYSEEFEREALRFDEQDVFEIVELKHEVHSKLDEAINLIKYIQGRCNYDAEQMIVKFLESVEND